MNETLKNREWREGNNEWGKTDILPWVKGDVWKDLEKRINNWWISPEMANALWNLYQRSDLQWEWDQIAEKTASIMDTTKWTNWINLSEVG